MVYVRTGPIRNTFRQIALLKKRILSFVSFCFIPQGLSLDSNFLATRILFSLLEKIEHTYEKRESKGRRKHSPRLTSSLSPLFPLCPLPRTITTSKLLNLPHVVSNPRNIEIEI
jgi:hypothetical protein